MSLLHNAAIGLGLRRLWLKPTPSIRCFVMYLFIFIVDFYVCAPVLITDKFQYVDASSDIEIDLQFPPEFRP